MAAPYSSSRHLFTWFQNTWPPLAALILCKRTYIILVSGAESLAGHPRKWVLLVARGREATRHREVK